MHATFTAFVCSGFTLTYTHYTVLSRVGNIKAHSHCGDRTSIELAVRCWDHVQNYSSVHSRLLLLLSPSNAMSLGPRPTSLPSGTLIHPLVWPQQAGRKLGEAVPLWRELGPHAANTLWPGPRPTFTPSGIV